MLTKESLHFSVLMPLFGWFSFSFSSLLLPPPRCLLCSRLCCAVPVFSPPHAPLSFTFSFPLCESLWLRSHHRQRGGGPQRSPQPLFIFSCASPPGAHLGGARGSPGLVLAMRLSAAKRGLEVVFGGAGGRIFWRGGPWQKSRPLPSGHEEGGDTQPAFAPFAPLCYVWGKSLHFIHSPPPPSRLPLHAAASVPKLNL